MTNIEIPQELAADVVAYLKAKLYWSEKYDDTNEDGSEPQEQTALKHWIPVLEAAVHEQADLQTLVRPPADCWCGCNGSYALHNPVGNY